MTKKNALFEQLKAALGDRYKPEDDELISMYIQAREMRPRKSSDKLKIMRMRLSLLRALGLTATQRDPEEDDDDPMHGFFDKL